MSQFGAIVGCLRTLVNRMADTKLTPCFFFALPAASLAAMTEFAGNATFSMRQFANLQASGVDGSVDCRVTYLMRAVFQFRPVCYLLRRPLIVQYLLLYKYLDLQIVENPFATAFLSPLPILFLCLGWPVAVLPAIPFQFPTDRASASSKHAADLMDPFPFC